MDKSMTQLIVLGAGWLGQPLCRQANERGWQVQGTRRNPDPTVPFERQFSLLEERVTHTLSLHNAWWVCAIPPRARNKDSQYLHTLEHALTLSKDMSAKGFLLCSSTGVYSRADGLYNEHSSIETSTDRQQMLVNAERMVLNQGGKVLRLAGLVGPNREPGQFIAAKALKSSSHGHVNMVHQQDVLNGIFTVLSNWHHNQAIYNLCHPWHPTRAQYYQQKCQLLETQPPTFSCDTESERIIDGSAIEQLGFEYLHAI
ncbi:Rossmann-fold NAD(P)-binding domain-containing protein [Pseudoalteromonas aurantia]